MSTNPLKLGEKIKKSYIDYLKTTFRFEDDEIMKQFSEKISENNFLLKGPILEIVPNFVKGKSLKEFIEKKIVSREFLSLNNEKYEGFNLERPLYKHQEEAIKKVISGKNIIVSTGTGSGKTESFLLPILDYILKEKEMGELGSGVRAMILYPMNALASDQLKRLREILQNVPDITFGAYTGEVPESYKIALENYEKLNKKMPLKNELISREQIKKSPPNILITNYSMLEYLLLRPEDNVLFSGKNKKKWKFLVIDEAHMYTGAKGIEISMLIRRLKNEIENGKDMQFVLTSASLGRGEQDFPEIAEFATKFCDSKFYQEDIIISSKRETKYENYYTYPKKIYGQVAKLIREKKFQLETIKEMFKNEGIEEDFKTQDFREFLFEIFSRDRRIKEIKEISKKNPISLIGSKESIFQDITAEILVDIVEIGNFSIKDGEVLIPGRYHMFARSLEGAVITLRPKVQIHLVPKETVEINDINYRAFELGVCQNCNKIYIIGEEITDQEGNEILKFSKNYSEEISNKNYYLLQDQIQDMDEETEEIQESLYNLCAICGRIKKKNTIGNQCSCGEENYVIVTKVESKEQTGKLHKCVSCAKVSPGSSIVRKILAGNEAATSVLADALYTGLEKKYTEKLKIEEEIEFDIEFIPEEETKKGREELENQNQGKQILVFSDSRQKAAFFATYFEATYGKIMRRQIIVKTLKEIGKKLSDYDMDDFIKELTRNIKKYFPEMSFIKAETEAEKAILYEFMALDGKNSLEDIGVLTYRKNMNLKNTILKELSVEESNTLLDIFFWGIRKTGAVKTDLAINEYEWNEYFGEFTKNSTFTQFKEEFSQGWLPSGKKNQRYKFLEKINQDFSEDIKRKILEGLWKSLVNYEYFIPEKNLYKLNLKKFKLKSIFEEDLKYYQCEKCKRMTSYNIRNICITSNCKGKLKEINVTQVMKDNHYFNKYLKGEIEKLSIAEHTAQLSKDEAKAKQREFIGKNINILSCSTTFEVGVDVGDLETVFMRNMPPSPANYVQRAGRAGRRVDSTAFSLTYSSLKSHDFTHYKNPENMISGKIAPPMFQLENKKIVKRHIYATSLSYFWKKESEYYGNNFRDFFGENKGINAFKKFIDTNPEELKAKLKEIVPNSLHDEIDIENWGWVDELISSEGIGKLQEVSEELNGDIVYYEELLKKFSDEQKFNQANYIKYNLNQMKSRKLIEVLAKKNIIPKYGFPVDTVSLEVNDEEVELTRDLKQALLNYTPDSEVIANGKIYKSRYVKVLPKKALDAYEYRTCKECNQIIRKRKFVEDDVTICNNCGSKIKKSLKESLEYRVPIYGFIAAKESKKAGTQNPKSGSVIEKFYVGENQNEMVEKKIQINKDLQFSLKYSKKDKMAVIGKGRGYGFYMCEHCGYSQRIEKFEDIIKMKKSKSHETKSGSKCNGKLIRTNLGYEFETDILLIGSDCFNKIGDKNLENSLLYAFLEGISRSISIERSDIDGCYYGINGKKYLVVYDNVPGGAGHVKRISESENLKIILKEAHKIVENCECSSDTSCYSCLKNYNNEREHEYLKRGVVSDFLANILKI